MKTKFNEKDVPKGTNWIATDKDGACFAFNVEPRKVDYRTWDVMRPDWSHLLYLGKPPKNWKNELYTWGY